MVVGTYNLVFWGWRQEEVGSSVSTLATYQVSDQPRMHEILSQKTEKVVYANSTHRVKRLFEHMGKVNIFKGALFLIFISVLGMGRYTHIKE